MTRVFTVVFQLVGVIIQVGNVLSGMVPPKYQLLVATVVGALQAMQGVIAHNYNPDGTPAAQAYVAPVLKCLGILFLCVALAGCASTSLGKSIQAADIQKQLVQTATIKAIVLCDQGKLDADKCATVKTTYTKWATGQQALADSLATWKTVQSTDNESKLQAALTMVKTLATDYLAFLGQFLDISAIAAALTP